VIDIPIEAKTNSVNRVLYFRTMNKIHSPFLIFQNKFHFNYTILIWNILIV